MIQPPRKSDVAKALLARRKEKLLAPEHIGTLTTLDSKLRAILDTATARLAQSSVHTRVAP